MSSASHFKQLYDAYRWRLHRNVILYVVLLLSLLGVMGWAESQGLSRSLIGPIFLFSTVMIYALIGVSGRTSDADEYYVAGRRIPAFYNGMATAADWMSAASFISLAGALYLQGFSGAGGQAGGLAYVMGWTGGFCLVALLIAPHLRAMELYTLPDFFSQRFGGRWPRLIAAWAAILCSFTYVIAQIYGIGLIASRLTGVQFEIGILLGLGGVLLCSFLGGMRAITWTQVAQYIILLIAFLIPVSWLAYKQLGSPWAPLAYSTQLSKIAELEQELISNPSEIAVRQEFLRRAEVYKTRLENVDLALQKERVLLERQLSELKLQNAEFSVIVKTRRELQALPKDAAAAKEVWQKAMLENYERAKPLGGMPLHGQAFQGRPDGTPAQQEAFNLSRINFVALIFCLMAGTAGLPHLLTRFYTVPNAAEARLSVAWSLLFIAILYLSAPALAVLVKFEVMNNLVGSPFSELPPWLSQWSRVDSALVEVADINLDGVLQFGELKLGADMIMLASPELAGLPYVISGLVAAGGFAAALSTADGLLLTISNAFIHDMRLGMKDGVETDEGRVILSKFALLAVAMSAAFVAAWKPAEILALVSASFSMAASAFFPGMVMGIFWKKASRKGVVLGMLLGLSVTIFYMILNAPALRGLLNLPLNSSLVFGIQPISAGILGAPAGFLAIWIGSLLWPDLEKSPSETNLSSETPFPGL
ncbi:VC_2705 family sodium/solute symporter [Limnohabitans sp. Rim11]|uniref:VC_2705 family sodium/solute symporter n=1 Tax=Limnohabitans sp. Rim11 TaxID=1100719 RepID=UPI000A40F0FB|nr:VC_2705 family sodium/solute symporter [Limnohabitans sp. Rim11]